MTRKTETVAHLDASIKRWKTRLKRAVTMIDKLERKRRRIAAKVLVASVIDPMVEALKPEKVVVFEPEPVISDARLTDAAGTVLRDMAAPVADDIGIPDFLKRGIAAQKAVDAVIADQIREEQATTKKAKAQGRIAKMKAKKSGDTRKMPLSGKAALDLIRNG
jgi:hypothetical protein